MSEFVRAGVGSLPPQGFEADTQKKAETIDPYENMEPYKAELEDWGEKCAVTMVISSSQAVEMAYYLAKRMDHRGPHAYGVFAFAEDRWIPLGRWVTGRVKDANSGELNMNPETKVHLVIMQDRYATIGEITAENTQPFYAGPLQVNIQETAPNTTEIVGFETNTRELLGPKQGVYIAHNGNFPLSAESWFKLGLVSDYDKSKSDSWHLAQALYQAPADSIEGKLRYVMSRIPGSGSIVGECDGLQFAYRDGNRPLFLASWQASGENCHAVVSEDSALYGFENNFGIKNLIIHELKPGELLLIKDGQVTSKELPSRGEMCALELVYFSRGNTTINGREINEYRRAWGKLIGQKHPLTKRVHAGERPEDRFVVVSAFNGGDYYAEGMAEVLKMSVCPLFSKDAPRENRTFTAPTLEDRTALARDKFCIDLEELKKHRNKDIIIVDDSLVGGVVSAAIVKNIIDAVEKIRLTDSNFKVAGIHFVSGSPLYLNQCKLGVNLPLSRLAVQKLLNHNQVETPHFEDIPQLLAAMIGYSSVYFPSLEDWAVELAKLSGFPLSQIGQRFCLRCMIRSGYNDAEIDYRSSTDRRGNLIPVIPLYTQGDIDTMENFAVSGYPVAIGGPHDFLGSWVERSDPAVALALAAD